MLRSKPKFSYCGLTVVLSNPSRFDTVRLLSGPGGLLFDNFCLRPEFNSMQCDIRLAGDNSPFLPNTKCILLLGDVAMIKYLPETINNNLSNIRGGLYHVNGIPTICSFLPQDCADQKNYEKDNNPLASDYSPDNSVSDSDEDEGDVKAFGTTKRSNYAFWLKRDVWKCKLALKGIYTNDGEQQRPMYRIYPGAAEAIQVLTSTKNELLYFDIETDYEEANLQCVSFNFSGSNDVYCVPILNNNYLWAYSNVHRIMRALAIAFRDNTVVAHNGSSFDFFVMSYKYRIPVNKVYDTMIAFQRCFPDIEKSLGHAVSYFTWEKFHKDEDSRSYHTQQQMMDRLKYCGKDVWTMRLVKEGIDSYSSTIPGLKDSISTAMECIVPYLTATVMGIRVNQEKVNSMVAENDRLMMQYNRMIEILIGEVGMKLCRASIKGKAKMFANSPKQTMDYFYNQMGYPVQRNPSTKEPSLGKKQMYILQLKKPSPVITLICAFRQVAKETSRLRFVPFPSPYDKNNSEHISAIQESNSQGISRTSNGAVQSIAQSIS